MELILVKSAALSASKKMVPEMEVPPSKVRER